MIINWSKECTSCDLLKLLLEQERHNNKKLLDALLELNAPKVPEVRAPEKPPEPVMNNMTWRIRQQMLEAEDREKARVLRKIGTETSIEELEKELGVSDAGKERETAKVL